MINVEEALRFSYIVASILGGGLFGIFMLAFFVRRAHAAGVYVGLAAGVLITTWGTLDQLARLGLGLPAFLREAPFPLHAFLLAACANVLSFTIGLVACLILPDRIKRDTTGLTVWDMGKAHLEGDLQCDR
jgi:Na+/proline symporter